MENLRERRVRLLAVVAALLLLAGTAACGEEGAPTTARGDRTPAEEPDEADPSPTPADEQIEEGEEPEDDPGEETSGEDGHISVTAEDFSFSPEEISVDTGEKILVRFSNEGMAPHTFTSSELGFNESVQPGETTDLKFRAPKQDGTYEFHCEIHPAMTGQILVGTGGDGPDHGETGEGEGENDTGTSAYEGD